MEPTNILVIYPESSEAFRVANCCREWDQAFFPITIKNIAWPADFAVNPLEVSGSVFDDDLPDVVILSMPQDKLPAAAKVFTYIRKSFGHIPVLVDTDTDDARTLAEFLQLGATDFLGHPMRMGEVLPYIWRLRQQPQNDDPTVQGLKERLNLSHLIGQTPQLVQLIQRIPQIARCNMSVLVLGETGTGKEIFARAIHHASDRSHKPFTPINCGAVPVELVENELFGHHPGAFTGALSTVRGLVHETEGGSLFLDEIDCLPLAAQVKLLRLLQEKEYRPLGSQKTCKADVRIIAASNQNLDQAVRSGRFRQDLYYRLNVITLQLPALRERKADIPLLVSHFIEKYRGQIDGPKKLSPAAMEKLMLYDWPGNVRELENVVERALVFAHSPIVQSEDIEVRTSIVVEETDSFKALKQKVIIDFERSYIQQLLRSNNGNISKAARAAHKDRRAFWELIRKHRIIPSLARRA